MLEGRLVLQLGEEVGRIFELKRRAAEVGGS